MLYVLLGAFIVSWVGVVWLISEINWSTGEWKQDKYKGKWLTMRK